MSGIHNETPAEHALADRLRAIVMNATTTHSTKSLCEKWDLAPSGVDRFTARKVWSISEAIRAAELLELLAVEDLLNCIGASR